MEPRHRVSDGGEHPLHLVLTAFVEGQLQTGRRKTLSLGRRRRSIVQLDASAQRLESFVRGLALDLDLVDLVHLVARVHEPVRKRAVIRQEEDAGRVRVELVLHEGRKHQVKRMLAAVGHPVTRLHRSEYAGLTLEGLEPGAWRELEPSEVERLRAQ